MGKFITLNTTSTNTSTTTPSFKPQRKAYKRLYNRADAAYRQGITYAQGSGVADRSGQTLQSLEDRARLAAGGSPTGEAAARYVTDTLEGRFLNSNPWLDATYSRAADAFGSTFNRSVLPSLEARFRRAGGTGGAYTGARNEAVGELASAQGDLANTIYGENYQAERERQTRAAALSPLVEQARYIGADQLAAVGAQEDAFSQRRLDDERFRFEREANKQWERVGGYANLISGVPAFTTTQTIGSGTTENYQPSNYARDKDWLQILTGVLGII